MEITKMQYYYLLLIVIGVTMGIASIFLPIIKNGNGLMFMIIGGLISGIVFNLIKSDKLPASFGLFVDELTKYGLIFGTGYGLALIIPSIITNLLLVYTNSIVEQIELAVVTMIVILAITAPLHCFGFFMGFMLSVAQNNKYFENNLPKG